MEMNSKRYVSGNAERGKCLRVEAGLEVLPPAF